MTAAPVPVQVGAAPGTVARRWSTRRLARRPVAVVAWVTLVLYAVAVLLGPLLISGDPLAQSSD